MTTAWDHLPNAAHIDRIMADLTANPDNWKAASDAAWNEAGSAGWNAAYYAVWAAASDAARSASRDAVWAAASDASSSAAFDAILALIAWDEAGDYFNLPVDQIRVLAELGDQRAILILPAVIAFESQREIVV